MGASLNNHCFLIRQRDDIKYIKVRPKCISWASRAVVFEKPCICQIFCLAVWQQFQVVPRVFSQLQGAVSGCGDPPTAEEDSSQV